jgi:hypothetical protein
MWHYVGEGAYLPGIPARDISDEEAQEREIEATLKQSTIYRHTPDRPEKPEERKGE